MDYVELQAGEVDSEGDIGVAGSQYLCDDL